MTSISGSSRSDKSRISYTSVTEPLYQVKLLAALRSGDPARIHPFLTDISTQGRKSEGQVDLAGSALHLAVRCASSDTIALLLSYRSVYPNAIHPPGSGTTALHVAASLGRAEVVSLLLDQGEIDDTLRDSNNKTCRDVARGKEVVKAIEDSRSFLTASYRSLLRTYILASPASPPPQALLNILSSPRIKHVDLSYIDDSSGTTLLHTAAKRKDLRLVELAVRAGADVFVRDRKGRAVAEGTGKDDRVRVFLRQFANYDTSLLTPSGSSSGPPNLKGYLNKYANVARGYNTRWFVLKDGILSYYRHQDDEHVASRGSIVMKMAILKTSPGSSGLRFEIHHTPSRGHHGVQKWYMRANHPVEARRWVQAINKNIEWYKQRVEEERPSTDVNQRTSLSTPSLKGSMTSDIANKKLEKNGNSSVDSAQSSITGDIPSPITGEPTSRVELSQGETLDDSSEEVAFSDRPPFDPSFSIQGNYVHVQLGLISECLQDILKLEAPSKISEFVDHLKESINNVEDMLGEYLEIVKQREDWWKKQLIREQKRQDIWEQSLQAVVKEGQDLEQELRNRTRRKSRMLSGSFGETPTIKLKRSQLPIGIPCPLFKHQPDGLASSEPEPSGDWQASPPAIDGQLPSPSDVSTPRAAVDPYFPLAVTTLSPGWTPNETESFVDTDEEDEFFDAIETNNLPNLVVSRVLKTHEEQLLDYNKAQYVGYRVLRKRLAITSDNRPPTSLWSVLKNSIGKDLTKISFPVFFNEPTGMLQRMAEDMEFPQCLDAASNERDPLRRIAFVAAFAMSNYSSTINRIAKPFNPMLGETFEYVHLEHEYRYVSEQVSHHPPISACWAESPCWRYYGEVDAQNKFMGKSFEIRPTGVAHADLLLPEDWEPRYPKSRGLSHKRKVVEHFSWKKVTTNVSGFILGSPTIDHYGDMTVVNHRTGDQCVLTFKPRGWRGKDAFEISGYVKDSRGITRYEIAGRWNSQLVARAVGTGIGYLLPDISPLQSPEYILLWRNSEKPPAPFNLTPFALTLNDCPEDTLKPVLCPTDCRLRPDQRAFELGKYERANELKSKQEERQRITRRDREEGKIPPHKPRWFTAETEPDTGERVWAPARTDDAGLAYWTERERVWRAMQNGDHDVRWRDVEDIFIEDEP